MNTNFDSFDKVKLWWNDLGSYRKAIDEESLFSIVSMGCFTSELESLIASMLGAKHCVCVSSGSAGLLASLLASDISSNSAICIPNRTFIATANAAALRGNQIVLIDSCSDHQNTSPESLAEAFNKLSELKKTIAYIYVPINGSFKGYKEIMDICNGFNVSVIVDACQSFGSSPVATKKILDSGYPLVYSFGLVKLVSTGLGGCIVTNSTKFYDKLISIRNQGINNIADHASLSRPSLPIGFNFKITDFQSLLGIQQVLNFTSIKQSHLNIFQHYYNRLNGVYNMPTVIDYDQFEVPLRFEVQVHSRDHLQAFLLNSNIESSCNTNNISDNINYYNANLVELRNSRKFSSNIITLPSGPSQELAKIDYVCDKMLEYSRAFQI